MVGSKVMFYLPGDGCKFCCTLESWVCFVFFGRQLAFLKAHKQLHPKAALKDVS